MPRLLFLAPLLLATVLWAQEAPDLSMLHDAESAMESLMMAEQLGLEVKREAADMGYAHYLAANIALAEGNLLKYELHTKKALEAFSKAIALEEPQSGETPL